MRSWWAVALGVVFGLLSVGILLLASQPPHGNAITLLPPPSPIPFQVHLSGEVSQPGVYALAPDSRVQDAVLAAGGFTDRADPSTLNLAAHLEDGGRIQVPAIRPTEIPVQKTEKENQTQSSTNITETTKNPITNAIININTASQEELETLTGIGPATAQKIIAFREENGPFTSIEEIQKVSGIGPVTFENIKNQITVDE